VPASQCSFNPRTGEQLALSLSGLAKASESSHNRKKGGGSGSRVRGGGGGGTPKGQSQAKEKYAHRVWFIILIKIKKTGMRSSKVQFVLICIIKTNVQEVVNFK
jgi:hypothetical protein